MPDFKHRHHKDSLISALVGLKTAFRTQPNFKIMIVSTSVAIAAGISFRLSSVEWLVLVLIIGVVYLAEMINTSIEAVVDLVTEEWRENAKIAKDVSGGMVLLSVILSIIIGSLIFIPKLFS